MQEPIGTRLIRYLKMCAVKPVVILIIVQFIIFLPCAIAPEIFADFLACDGRLWIGHIWRPVSATFCHEGFGHLFFNMLLLYLLGRWILQVMSFKFALGIVFFAGTAANILHSALFDAAVIGFSGANMALITAATVRQPKSLLLFFPAWIFVSVKVGIDFIYFINSFFPSFDSLGIAHDVHFLGAAFGFLAINSSPMLHKLNLKIANKKRERNEAAYADELSRVDSILEKISKEGLHTLSDEERSFLNKHSQRERARNP